MLKVKLHVEKMDWEDMRQMQLAFFKTGHAGLDAPQDHAFIAQVDKFSEKLGVKYILNGYNIATEIVANPESWNEGAGPSGDGTYIKDVLKKHGGFKTKHYTYTSGFKHKFWLPYVKGVKTLQLLNYVPITKKHMITTLEQEYGYEAYSQKHYEDQLTKFIEGWWLPTRFGYDIRKAQLSSLVVTGQMTRDEALEILKGKRNGNYNIVKIDADYVPAVQEKKQVFGITFEQGRNNFRIDEELLSNMVTDNKELPEEAKRDLIIALITLKYTQSNSVCYAYDGQAIGVGAGQQSRIHCTRLAGTKADTWHLRQHPKVLNLPFKDDIRRPDRDNVIDGYINKNEEDVCAEGIWQKYFKTQPEPLTDKEAREFLDGITGVSVGSDAFFPFSDNIERARKSGVSYIAEPGGSIRDDVVIDCCNKYGIAMAFTGMRLFHH